MHTKDLVVHHCCNCQVVENLSERSPYIQRTVFFDTLVVEAVDLSDESGLVVASEESDSVFIPDFEGQQQEECLNTVTSAIDVVAQEDVVGIWGISSNLKKLE